jgi:hypothetical protein
VEFTTENLRRMVIWSELYRSEWDNEPDRYLEAGTVKWARSRRLGLFEYDGRKAYLGVQHVDPARPGWATVAEPHARFFVSMFVGAQCVSLRTVPTMSSALSLLSDFLARDGETH